MRLGDAPAIWDVEAVYWFAGDGHRTGHRWLAARSAAEVFGLESSGKTTLTLSVVAEVQRAGGTAAFVDAEHALDPSYAEKLGVNIGELLVSQPTRVSRRWRSPTCWCAPVRWTWWSSIRSRH